MGQLIKKARKATFKVTKTQNHRIFTPVNKRAWRYARVLGTNTLTADDLRTIKANGTKVYQYQNNLLKVVEL